MTSESFLTIILMMVSNNGIDFDASRNKCYHKCDVEIFQPCWDLVVKGGKIGIEGSNDCVEAFGRCNDSCRRLK